MKIFENLNWRVIVYHFIIVGIFITTPLILFLRSDNDYRLLWATIMFSVLAIFYILNISVLIPKYLKKGQYLRYFGILLLTFVIAYFILFVLFQEYGIVQFENKNPLNGGIRGNDFSPFMIVIPLIIYYTLGISFESIVESLKQKRSKEEALKEKVKAELSFLKSQINPHFLFNSLNSIYSLSMKKSELTNDAILLLSNMMRYMLYESNGSKVSLKKEINYIENFIALQRLRIAKKDCISIRFNCNGDPNGHLIEPLLFIPFVENAFKHGISYKETSIVDIKLSILHDKLIFEIINSRPKKHEVNLDSTKFSGIGLNNIGQRLDLLYPDKYKLIFNDSSELFSTKLELNLA